jgi:large subunit ribosomal protein L13
MEELNMSTFMANAGNITRKWYILDAAGKPLGRVAAQAAVLLRGKHKPTFTPNADCGDHVIIINAEKAVLTGKKLEQKKLQWHTGWIGGLKEIKYSKLMAEEPERAMTVAIEGMLPHNTLGRNAAKRLRVYRGAEHNNAAQKPEVYNV